MEIQRKMVKLKARFGVTALQETQVIGHMFHHIHNEQ